MSDLPKVGGRKPVIYTVAEIYAVADTGAWVHWPHNNYAEYFPTREAAEAFVRECAAKEANGGGEMLGGSSPSQPATDSPPLAETRLCERYFGVACNSGPFAQELLEAALRERNEAQQRLDRSIAFCRASLHPGVNIGRQAMAGEVLKILEGNNAS